MADLIAWPIVLVAALVGSLLTSEPEDCPADQTTQTEETCNEMDKN